ncbi:WxL protein peptidoglycan domain-containing protein, partial [Actinocorallia lasiicapitis]
MFTPWVLAAGLLLAPASAPAADFSWSVQPSGPKGPTGRDYFVYTVAPGQTVRDTVGITNRGDKPLTFRIYPTDAFTTEDGSFALLTADKQPSDVGSWVRTGLTTVTVKPGKRADVPFTLKVPRNATPGDHTGGVLAAVTEQQTTADGQRVNVDRRVAARVYLRVNGPVTAKLEVDRIAASAKGPIVGSGTVTVTYRVRNTGNVRLKARAHVATEAALAGAQGRPADRDIPELLPGSSMTFTDTVPEVLPAGPLKVSVRLTPTDPAATDGRP